MTASAANAGGLVTKHASSVQLTVDAARSTASRIGFQAYFLRIKRKIEMTWSYPTSSLQRGETGQVVLRITLNMST